MPWTADDAYGYEQANEGYHATAYDDGYGNVTVGVGHNLESNPHSDITNLPGHPDFDSVYSGQTALSSQQIEALFDNDWGRATQVAEDFAPNLSDLPSSAQLALQDMAFNLGAGKLSQFTALQQAIADQDMEAAAAAMQASAWASQVGQRANFDMVLMDPQSLIDDVTSFVHNTVQSLLDQSQENWDDMGLTPPTPPDSPPINLLEEELIDNPNSSTQVDVEFFMDPWAAFPPPAFPDPDDFPDPSVFSQDDLPGWDGGAFGDPTSYPDAPTDGYAGDDGNDGTPGDYGDGGSYGGAQVGAGESGGQFSGGDLGGEGGYQGEGGYGGYGDTGDDEGDEGDGDGGGD